jgi:Protein of unknown function (DUF2811)
MDSPVSLFVEIPETLHASLSGFLDDNQGWDQDRVIAAGVALFLLQNRNPGDRQIGRIYLDSLFQRPVGGGE